MQDYPLCSSKFLDSLPYVLRFLKMSGGALYIYDAQNHVFLLKKWFGNKPAKFSVDAEHQFIKYLKVRKSLVSREEFVKKSHELRQSALFFFQETSSDKVVAVLDDKNNWLGFLSVYQKGSEFDLNVIDELLIFYSELIKSWIRYDRIFQEYRKLSELGQIKSELMTNVTHEFKTPLNGILGMAEAILDGADGELKPSLKEHIEMIYKSGKDLSETLDNILKLTQIEAQKNKIKFERADLKHLIHEVLSLYQPIFHEKKIQCVLAERAQSCVVLMEEDYIRTVLMNLIGNAAKFTEQGKIEIDFKKNGEMLHVSIQDTGVGIDESKQELIFEEFYQGDGSQTRQHGGTGMGLAIARKIISLHGGRIWAESRLGHGACFTFTLPVFPG